MAMRVLAVPKASGGEAGSATREWCSGRGPGMAASGADRLYRLKVEDVYFVPTLCILES